MAERTPPTDVPVPREYIIAVCPKCGRGPLDFDPNGLDRDEGMTPRAHCVCGSYPTVDEAVRLRVVSA